MLIKPQSTTNSSDYQALSKAQLLALLAQKDAQLATEKKQKEQLESSLVEFEKGHLKKDKYIEILEELLRLKKAQQFSASSEKLAFQVDLFDEAELAAAIDELTDQLPDDIKPDEDTEKETAGKKKKSRQRGFSPDLERVRVELTLSDEEKAGADRTFFVKVKDELEYIPAKLQVKEYWQEKAVFTDGPEDRFITAQRPNHPLGKCSVSTSVLAQIITAKYADGLPLYRQEAIFKRYGADISRSNMANWIIRLHDGFVPLINLIREDQNTENYLQIDETRIQVLKETGKTAQSDKWMWVTRSGSPDKPSVLFYYDPSRSAAVPERLLAGFNGTLQADGYSGYGPVVEKLGLTRIGCMDHCRRKFVEASKAAGVKNKKGKVTKANVAIGMIGKLYALEKKIKDLDAGQKYDIRQEKAVPILNEIKAWLDKNESRVMKGSLTHTAIIYALNQWPYLVGYCNDGNLHISNVLAENAIRPFATGRKAWLFADSSKGAHASATLYSLIETAKANKVEPYSYINYLLDHIGDADTLEKLEALLPWNVPMDKFEKKVSLFKKGQ